MRRFAGKCVALLMALLMLLTSMPLTALADNVVSSVPYSIDVQQTDGTNAAGSPTQLEVVKAAAAENTSSGQYVQVYAALVQTQQPIQTGAQFVYEIGYMLGRAPTYNDASGEPQAAYSQYENVEITIDVPSGIVLLDGEGNEYRDTYTISLGNRPITGATGQTVTVNARMDGNGSVADNTTFDKLGVKIDADVTVAEETVPFTYTLPDASNNSAVTNEASGVWDIVKTQANDPVVNGDEVTLTWTIEIGKVVGTGISGSTSDYNTTGVLNFANFTLTDTLPTITGKDGQTYLPKRSTLSADGMQTVNGGEGVTTLSTNYHATTDLTAGGVNTTTPYYTKYTVTATYDRAAFVLPYGDTTEVSYTNTAEMEYQLVGKPSTPDEASAVDSEGYPTAGGTITVYEELQLGTNGSTVEYNSFYASLFPNGATFEVYAEEDWDADNNTPRDGAEAITLTVGNEDGATTAVLAPGTAYYIYQTGAPDGSETPAIEGAVQRVEVTSGGNAKITFTNLVKEKGILEIDKEDASGNALSGVEFTLTSTTGDTYVLSGLNNSDRDGVIDSNGHGVIVLPVGTYTLEETTVPDGYVKMKPVTVVINEGATNNTYTGQNALVNYADTGSLTITKKLAEYAGQESTVDVSSKITDATFTFNIYRSTSTPVSTTGDPYTTATIAAGSFTVTVPALDVADENGNPYYYTVVEVNGEDSRFDYDTAPISFTFSQGDGVYTTSATATFTNVLKSKLTFQKNEDTLDGTKGMDDVEFYVYADSPTTGTLVDTVTTANGGVGTTKPLPIKDANGDSINYYIVEVPNQEATKDHTVDYPGEYDYYGPITLSFAETTTAGQAIVNKKNETSLTVKKTDKAGAAIAGATFTVQNASNQYAAIDPETDALTWQTDEATLTTDSSGQIVLSGIPNGTYTVTEKSVPGAYLSTGTVTGADEGTASTSAPLSGKVTLTTLQQKTITFANDKKPVLEFTKNVEGTVSGSFTFELYKANEDGTAPEGEKIGDAVTVTDGGKASFTVDAEGKYFLKEIGWPAGVIDPSITTQSGNGVYVDDTGVYYGPYELKNNEPNTTTINNTPNTGSLTINKVNAKVETQKLAGATFTVSVDTTGWSSDLIALLPSGFTAAEGSATYVLTTGATNANGQVSVNDLPVYNGSSLIVYTVAEATAPANYLKDEASQTASLTLNNNAYTASLTFKNPPVAKAVITKTWYSQWESDSGNRIDYALAGADIAIFEEVNGKLVQVGDTQTTGTDGTTTFDGLDGTKTYYVFELSNTQGLEAEEKQLAGNVNNIVGKSATDALNTYYGATLSLNAEADNQAEAKLVNVETYVQLTLNKWYQPEKNMGTDEQPDWQDDPEQSATPLNRAKFHLYYCTLEAYEAADRSIQKLVGSAEGMERFLYSDYVYESGISNAAGDGAVVTGALPGGYVYWFNEFEAPAGFVQPTWPASLSVAFVPDDAQGNEVSYKEDKTPSASMENHPAHGGPGTIRYLQVMVDKVARPEGAKDNTKDEPLPNTTFELWLTDSTYTERVERVAKFTTGVDLPEGSGEYLPGRGVSESIQMHRLYEKYGGDENGNYVIYHEGELINGVQHGEYEAYFVLIETEWPANTTPVSYIYPLHIHTNQGDDADGSLATLNNTYTTGREGPIVNTLAQQVTVAIEKVGYSADDPATTWPLSGAEITIYSDSARTQEVASGKTGEDGLVYFTLDPMTTYYWKETVTPNGYEPVDPANGSFAFTTPDYSSGLQTGADDATEITPVVTVQNVQYRTLQLAKVDENGNQVAATLAIYKGNSATGTPVATVETKTEGYAEVKLPAGTYTVAETKLGESDLSTAEKSNFGLINDNETFTFQANEAVKQLTFKNPGTGSLTLTKTDDADAAMEGVEFTLNFKAFSAADVSATTAPEANTVTGDVQKLTGVTVSTADLTTDANGQITLSNLVPGWYKLTEVSGEANENYVLADPVVVKVTASNFGTPMADDTAGSASVTVKNTRKGYLTVEKAYEGGFEDDFDKATAVMNFGVYTDAACQNKVTEFSVTGESRATAVALNPGTYYVKELTSGKWYTNYAVDYTADVDDRTDVARTWLSANGGAVQVTVDAKDTVDQAVVVSFTNVGYLANVEFDKVGKQGDTTQPLSEAQFVLYYLQGSTPMYYTGSAWVIDIAQAASYESNAEGKVSISDIQLPYGVVTAAADMNGTYYIKEKVTPDEYTAPETDAQITLKPGDTNTALTGNNAIVNEKGVVITLTKYNKPYAVTEGRAALAGAEFTLYHMNAAGEVLETISAKTTGPDGTVQFVNLPQLKNGEYYAIQETKTPAGYLEGSLELYDVTDGSAAAITAVNGYFPVATDTDVTLDAYNTPLGKIAILKYDYVDRDAKPVGATFTATNDEDGSTHYNGTLRLAQNGDETTLDGGYTLDGDHYVKDGIFYTIAYVENVVPGKYTVVETNKPNGYLYTPDSDEDDPWHTTQHVTVENDGSTAVVVFANLPDPSNLSVDIQKSAKYLGEGGLQGEDYQTIEFTLSDFTSGTELPLENATLKDDTFSFTDESGNPVTGVEWYVESVTIGAAEYKETVYGGAPSDASIYATINVKDTDGAWTEMGPYVLDNAQTITFAPNECQGIEIVYGDGTDDGGLEAGFTAGDVVLTVKARQPVDDETTVPVAKVGNTASISMTYDFGVIGADIEDEDATKTKTDSASADVEIEEEQTLPRASIEKTSQVQTLEGTPVTGEIVTPGQRLLYTITLTGESEEMMEKPILADTLPAGVSVVEGGITAVSSDTDNLQVANVQQAGQNISVTTTGYLAKGETLTLTILVDVLPTVLINSETLTNTAYAFNNVTVPKNVGNEYGSSFTDEAGKLPSVSIPEAFANIANGGSGMAISGTVQNSVASASGVTIDKMVSVDNVNWVANESLLVAEKGGNIYYRVTVSNNGSTALTNLRILDVLPYAGDGRSYWGPTLSGSVSTTHGTVYYSTETPAESADTIRGDLSGWSTDASGAKSFLAVVDMLPAGQAVTLTYTTKAPENPVDTAYYQLAINTAHCMYANGPSIPLSSADTKVTIMPEKVSLGDRVWVDENANGIQDTNEIKVPGGTTTFTLYPYMEDDPGESRTTTADANGYYIFEGLNPAAPQGGSADYFASGDVDYTSLMGNARATYQLAVSIPTGYRLTVGSKTTVEGRQGNDSDFAATGETIKFYIPAGGMDDTYDVGVIRDRNLTIVKKGTNNLNVAGAEFKIYGPYYVTPNQITADDLVATITTGADGRATFTSTADTYLNAYAYYVVVETSTPANYSAANLTATGDSVVASPKPDVTGEGIVNGNYFVLEPFAGENMNGAVSDTVDVENTYSATGELTVKGTKVLTGDTLADGDFSFTLTSTDDKDVGTLTASNKDDGSFAFDAIQYTYADVQYLRKPKPLPHTAMLTTIR